MKTPGRSGHNKAVLATLLAVFDINMSLQDSIFEAIQRRWNYDRDFETRAAILQYMVAGAERHYYTLEKFMNIISDGLDDYTTTARGDVGSLVRIEAAKTARTIWDFDPMEEVCLFLNKSRTTLQSVLFLEIVLIGIMNSGTIILVMKISMRRMSR